MTDWNENIEQERLSALQSLRREWSDLYTRFQPGTLGFHELWDRAGVLQGQWDAYVSNHPACLIDKERYAEAAQIASAMHDFCQKLTLLSDYEEPDEVLS